VTIESPPVPPWCRFPLDVVASLAKAVRERDDGVGSVKVFVEGSGATPKGVTE
jgi:hypothetical protein